MLQTWRWYGPSDPVSLEQIKQTGATGIVTALHDTYEGQAWSEESVIQRREEIEAAGLVWAVVESIPVHTSIKLATPEAGKYIDAYKETIRILAKAGVKTICYNFMPVVDWTRTDLYYPAPNGGFALRFEMVDFVAYDVLVLKRPNAADDYPADLLTRAKARFSELSAIQITTLEQTIIAGLPGAELFHDRPGILAKLADYAAIDSVGFRDNLIAFLTEIIPVAESVGVKMCLHPDDPPFSLFGLPRVVSNAEDYRAIFAAVPSLSNGITFCTGSLGPLADNHLVAMAGEFADRVHFTHLRNIKRGENGSFFESDHLAGDLDLVGVIDTLLKEEQRRRQQGRSDWQIPLRPDHGHLLLDDIEKKTNPGYSLIGRMKGLAEIRGVMAALESKYA